MNSATTPTIDDGTLYAILGAYHGDPFAVLGMHQAGDNLVVRVLRPDAEEISILDTSNGDTPYPAQRVHQDGFFEAVLPENSARFPYKLKLKSWTGEEWTEHDPYSYGQLLGDVDLHLFAEG